MGAAGIGRASLQNLVQQFVGRRYSMWDQLAALQHASGAERTSGRSWGSLVRAQSPPFGDQRPVRPPTTEAEGRTATT